MDSADLDSLAWRALELAVQQRDDHRIIVATRRSIGGPTSTARLVAGLCNAASGRLAVALFGVDGSDIVGVAEPPDVAWVSTVSERFPGVVPELSTVTLDADGALVVALAAADPGTPVVATHGGRAVVPWFDGELADAPPPHDTRPVARPAGRVAVRSGWLEHHAHRDPPNTVGVWRGMLDIALALDPLDPLGAEGATPAGGLATIERADPRRVTRRVIADRDLSVTLLADDSGGSHALDVQIHPVPAVDAVVRVDGGVDLDPLMPCRLYLAAAVDAGAPPSAHPGDTVRLLITLRFPGDERVAAAMATLSRDGTSSGRRWVR